MKSVVKLFLKIFITFYFCQNHTCFNKCKLIIKGFFFFKMKIMFYKYMILIEIFSLFIFEIGGNTVFSGL